MKTCKVYRMFPWVARNQNDQIMTKIDDVGDEYWTLENDYADAIDNKNAWHYVNINPDQICTVTDDEYAVNGLSYPYCEIKMTTGDIYYLPCLWKDAGIT